MSATPRTRRRPARPGPVPSHRTARRSARLSSPVPAGRRLVGRDRELGQLAAAVLGGAGAVLTGPSGVGKTALANATAATVEEAGQQVEWVVATEASRPIPFGALAPLLPDDLSALHPVLVLAAIIRRQRELGRTRPPLLVVDDAHLLDDHSAATLLSLVTSGHALVLATVRTEEPAPDAVTTLWKDAFVEMCDVGPFDRSATEQFVSACLGGEVAVGTATQLWRHTGGNALFLSELVRHARTEGQLVDEHGVWMWRGDLTVPPRLAELLERKFDGLDAAAVDALGALVLGEPLSLGTLRRIASLDAVAELEKRRLVRASERDGLRCYRFAHPMLAAAAALRITPAHRCRLADALGDAEVRGVDAVRRAMWQLDASRPPDVDLLLESAGAVLLTQPALAHRMAEAALRYDPGPRAALALADACAELGQVDAAHAAQTAAVVRVRSDQDRLDVRLRQVSLTAFSDRRPDLALEQLAQARVELPERFGLEIDSMAAQITVFSGRPADALALADRVLRASPSRPCAIRASSARVVALALADRAGLALPAADDLLADVAAGPLSPNAQGVAHVCSLMVHFVHWKDQYAPAIEPCGRWPVPSVAGAPTPSSEASGYPLFEGGRRLLEGHVNSAIGPLREAVAQQRSGEGLLRSEAVALLVIALAAAGQQDEAHRLLEEAPPDRLCLYPGLLAWAASNVEAATGGSAAVPLAFEAYEQARAAGSVVSAVAYLHAVARYGAATRAAAELDAWAHDFEGPLSAARAMSIRARANGDAQALLDAATTHAALGLAAEALGLAELATAASGRDRSGNAARSEALAREMRRRLFQVDTTPGPLVRLTRRELEVATLAATGMADQDIAARLIVSVRTVESHLAAAYRKLSISSRRALRDALQTSPSRA